MASCTDRSDSREEGSRKKATARDITAACVSGKIHYVIPVPLLFVARCTYQAMRQRHPQPIGGARSGWRRNARALRDDRKTKQNELAVRTLARRLVLLGPETNDLFMLLQMLDDCRHVRSLDCLPYWRPLSLFFLRTWHYELCIKASIPLPINSTLCLTIPGPAECAKRLNDNNNNNQEKHNTNNS